MFLTYSAAIDPVWAWAPYVPDAKAPWNLEKAGHLFRRAAWGGTWSELQAAVKAGPQASIDQLLAGREGLKSFQERVDQLAAPLAEGIDELRLRAWWFYVMLNSPHPLLERMTLFWHNHFATSNAKVQDVGRMYKQNRLLRTHALGRFGPMLHEISEDPAMLVWLDTTSNKKGKPNENYARELMELFSLGVGNYTEQDIRQAARAFTGWEIKSDRFHINASDHDDGEKEVFNKRNNFNGHQIVDLCLEKPACAVFLARKLFRYFVSETIAPDDTLLAPVAKRLRDSGYDIGATVGMILRSNLFFSHEVYRTKVKAPVEFAISCIHMLEGRVDSIQLADILDPLGQRLFAPPSVKGWDGGPDWLNSTTMLLRHNLCLALTSTEDRRFYNRCDPVKMIQKNLRSVSTSEVLQFLVDLFLQGQVPDATRSQLSNRLKQLEQQKYPPYWSKEFVQEYQIRSLCHLVMTLPEFQLA